MNAKLGTYEANPSQIVAAVHPPIIGSMEMLAGEGVIADGQILAKDEDGKGIAHQAVAPVAMTGAVNGANKDFTATLTPAPVMPGSVVVTDDADQELVDDGNGNLVGDGSGTIEYKSGVVAASFTAAPAALSVVAVAHKTQPVGVNVGKCDTDAEGNAVTLKHGAVNRDLLLIGSEAAAADDIEALEARGIFAV
jgi:hypothetical protein